MENEFIFFGNGYQRKAMNVRKEINNIIVKKFSSNNKDITKHEDILPEYDFVDDLGFDSLDFVEMIMALETKFAIEIPDEIAYEWKKVENIYDFFEKGLDKK